MPRPRAKINPDATEFESEVGANIRKWREKRGLSQREAARQIGVAYHVLQCYETAANTPSIFTVHLICQVLQIPIDALAGKFAVVDDRPKAAKSIIVDLDFDVDED